MPKEKSMKGHNSNEFFGGLSAEHLKQFIERVERLESEKTTIVVDIKEVFAEAKGTGFDIPTMKQILKLRKKEQADLEEEEYLLDTYKRALGMLPEQAELFEPNNNISVTLDNGKIKTTFTKKKS